jgi:hypothetical protein
MQPAKACFSLNLAIMRSQWDVAELHCCDNCIDKRESVLDNLNNTILNNLNDGPDDEDEGTLPSPKPIYHRRLHVQHIPPMISIGSHQIAGPVHNPRSSYNRAAGTSGLESERKLETRNNFVDRSAEFEEILQAL